MRQSTFEARVEKIEEAEGAFYRAWLGSRGVSALCDAVVIKNTDEALTNYSCVFGNSVKVL